MGSLVDDDRRTKLRLLELRAMLASRTLNGKPKPGYRVNVERIRGEIAKLEAETSDVQDPE